jgi:hypothetical protein
MQPAVPEQPDRVLQVATRSLLVPVVVVVQWQLVLPEHLILVAVEV